MTKHHGCTDRVVEPCLYGPTTLSDFALVLINEMNMPNTREVINRTRAHAGCRQRGRNCFFTTKLVGCEYEAPPQWCTEFHTLI